MKPLLSEFNILYIIYMSSRSARTNQGILYKLWEEEFNKLSIYNGLYPPDVKSVSKFAVRTIPYFIDDNKIYLILTTIKKYGDWTAFGGGCNIRDYHDCASKELHEESRAVFTRNKYWEYINMNANVYYINYINHQNRRLEFLQFLLIDKAYADMLVSEYNRTLTEGLPEEIRKLSVRDSKTGNIYNSYLETEGIKVCTLDEFKFMLFCSIEKNVNILLNNRCPETRPISISKCFDYSIVVGIISHMIKYLYAPEKDPFISKILSSKKLYENTVKSLSVPYNKMGESFNIWYSMKPPKDVDNFFAIMFSIIDYKLRNVK